MKSAFGIEHGDEEIAKFDAAGILKPLKSAFGATKKFGEGMKSGYSFKPTSPGTAKINPGLGGNKTAAQRGNTLGRMAGANKKVTAGVVGGGVAGMGAAGATGYAMGNKNRY